MRKKAEKKIREAAAKVGGPNCYRIDKVREKAGLIRKVFDKTLLDMARLEAIELKGGDTGDMNSSEIANLIHRKDELQVYFTFLDDEILENEVEPEISESVSQRSKALFDSGYYCAESVLLAIAEAKNIQSDVIPKIATGFCGGTSRTCGMCGAINGAIMAINLFYGRNAPEASVEDNYRAVRKLIELFQDKFGTTNCKELIDCDLGTEDGREHFKSENLREQCKIYTKEATKIAVSLIEK